MKLFALNSSKDFGDRVADALGVSLSDHEEREFDDGEHKARPLVSVRGEDVYVIQSLHGDADFSANDKLCRLLFFLGAVRDAGAARVTAVTPYLAYARKDRRTKSRDPLTTRYVAQLFEAMGIDAIVTLDTHNVVAFQNAFRCEAVHLDSRLLFGEHLVKSRLGGPLVVASPDPGGVKRAQLFQEMLEKLIGQPVGSALMEKRRSAGIVSGDLLVGDVDGTTVLVIDDMIASGGTMVRAAQACHEVGARAVYAVAAHGLFVGDAGRALSSEFIAKTLVTDTIPPFRLAADIARDHLEVVTAAPLFAGAIRCLHENGSINALLEG
jgi:ribose-phosphate pyrophosphokinase